MHIDFTDEVGKLTDEIEKLLEDVLQYAAEDARIHGDSELSVVFVTNKKIKQLNDDYRNKNEVTDVLSFPLLDSDEVIQADRAYPFALGDIVISYERAEEQADEYGHSLEREIAFLAVHSFLHLLGYTHDSEEKERVMFAKQEAILKEFHLER